MALRSLQAELTLKMDELSSICRNYNFDATPAILLIHRKGYESSLLLSNAHSDDIVACVTGLAGDGNESEMSVSSAAINQIMGAGYD